MTRARDTSENARLAKAWVNFNGTGTVAIRADFNVSSITDNGTGSYTINFDASLSDSNYCVLSTTAFLHQVSFNIICPVSSVGITTSSVAIATQRTDTNALVDPAVVCVAIFR